MNFLIMALKLPDFVYVQRAGTIISQADIKWVLTLQLPIERVLDSEQSLGSAKCKVESGDKVGLKYEFKIHEMGGFMTAPGPPQGKFSSSLWNDEEMIEIRFVGHDRDRALITLLDKSISRLYQPREGPPH